MKIKYLLLDLIPIWHKPKSEIKRNLYFSLFISINITLGVLVLLIDVFLNFFTVYFAVFNTLFIGVGVTSSESFYELIKNQLRILLAVAIGLLVAYITYIITFNDHWTSVFITVIFIFISSGFMIGSKLLPYNLGKLMYLSYFNLAYFNTPIDRSPIPYLKFLLTGVTPLILVFITGIIFNIDFSSTYYIQSCTKILKTSRKIISIMEREFEIKTLEAIDYPLDVTYQRNIMQTVANRIDNESLFMDKKSNALAVPIYFKNQKSIEKPTNLTPLTNVLDRMKFNEHGSPTSSINTEFTTTSNHNKNKPVGETIPNLDKYSSVKSLPRKLTNTHNFFRISLEQLNMKSSRNLNRMEKYLIEAKREFWNKDLFGYFNELSYLLETNHKKLLTINMAVLETIGSDKSKTLIVVLPHLNTLITTTIKLFRIMEKQISKQYKPTKITDNLNELISSLNNDKESVYQSIDITKLKERGKQVEKSTESIERFGKLRKYKTLEYSQYRVMLCFDCIEKSIKDINSVLGEMYDPETSFSNDNMDEESRVNFLLSSFKKFSKDQKVLASTVFMVSLKLWSKNTNGRNHHLIMIKSISLKFIHYFTHFNLKKIKKLAYNKEFPNCVIQFTMKERIVKLFQIFMDRLLVKWNYSLVFSIGLSIYSIVYYELKLHSDFILFRNLAWGVITYCLVSAPSVGAISFFSILRVIGAVLGSLIGYGVAVIYSLTDEPARALIFAAATFICAFLGCVFTRAKSFEKLVLFFILSFVVIAFLAYPSSSPSIIISLFRMMHILVSVLLVLIVTILFCPYYEYKKLKENLYQFPFKITQSFNFLICNTLLDPNISPVESRVLYYRSNRSNYIQSHIPAKLTYSTFKELMSKQLNLLRYQIPIQRSLLFHSRYELFPFNKKKYYQLRRLQYTETKLFHALLSLEFIVVSALPKIHLVQVSKIISTNLIKLMCELDYITRYYMREITPGDKSTKVISNTNYKSIVQEIARDINEYIYRNRYDLESLNLLRYCSAIIFCLISFIDLFDLVVEKVIQLSKTIIIKRINGQDQTIDEDNGDGNNEINIKDTSTPINLNDTSLDLLHGYMAKSEQFYNVTSQNLEDNMDELHSPTGNPSQ